MLNFEMRQSGRRKAVARVDHHIGGLEIFKIICRYTPELPYSDQDRDEELPWPRLFGTGVERLVRQSVWKYGAEAYASGTDWTENYQDREVGRIARWAHATMRRLYPELLDQQYYGYVDELTRLPLDKAAP